MNIVKKTLGSLSRCYAVSHTYIDGELKILFASEGEDKCVMYSAPDFTEVSTVWEKPGGTMSVVFLPDNPNEFLAIQKFLPTFQAEDAVVVWGKYEDGKWDISDFLALPYLHRFDIITSGGVNYFIGCTLATSKKDKDDWSNPGKIYAGVFPDNPTQKMDLVVIKEGLLKNHGYCRGVYNGSPAGYVSSMNGVFAVIPPSLECNEWTVKQISAKPTSDIAFADIDGDGVMEMAAIEEFHGKDFKIYKFLPDGKLKQIYEYGHDREFGHVVWGGMLRGIPTFIGGFRRPVKDMFYIQCESGFPEKFKTVSIETEGGPSNIDVIHERDRDIIATANRESAEAALYIVTE